MFGDSSQDIFSAVGFLRARVKTPTGKENTELAFVFGKARVAPMKVMTVPKLELQAALLAAQLKREITQALTVTVNQVFMWTDSTTVLQWINSNEKQPIFVRVSTVFAKFWSIPALTNGTTWQLRIIQLTLARVECPLGFCN